MSTVILISSMPTLPEICGVSTVAYPDLELRVGGGFSFTCPTGFPPAVVFSFFTQNKGVPGLPGPFPTSTTGL